MGKICVRIKFASPLGSPHVARVASFLLSTPERKSMRQRREVGLSEGVTHSAMVELSIPAPLTTEGAHGLRPRLLFIHPRPFLPGFLLNSTQS